MLRRLNDALPGLVATIIGYGLVIQFAGVWFVEDKAAYSIGLWYGIAIAVGLAIHIASVLWDAVSMGESKDANRRIIAKCLLRYFVVAVLLILGVLGLKIGAYLQPLFEKAAGRLFGRRDAASDEEIVE